MSRLAAFRYDGSFRYPSQKQPFSFVQCDEISVWAKKLLTRRRRYDIILLKKLFGKFSVFRVHFAIFYVYICEGIKKENRL